MKPKKPNIVPILVLTLITAVAWIFFSIYRTVTTKPAPVVPDDVSKALTPTLNKDEIQKLNGKLFLDESQIPTTAITGPIETSPTPIPLSTGTPTATLSAQTPTASPSGTISP